MQQICQHKANRNTFLRIMHALRNTKGSLTQVDIPDSGSCWKSPTQSDKIHDAQINWTQEHVRQANQMPFGSGGTLHRSVDPNDPGNAVGSILQGTFVQLDNTTLETNQWIVGLSD